jgi:hypothetical protein
MTKQSQAKQGEPFLRQGLDICRKAMPEGHWATANIETLLGGCLTGLGQYQKAEPLLLNSYKGLEAAPGAPPVRRTQALDRIVELYEAWGKPDKVAEWRGKRSSAAKVAPSPEKTE